MRGDGSEGRVVQELPRPFERPQQGTWFRSCCHSWSLRSTLGVDTNYDPAWVMMGGRADGAAVGVLRGAGDNGGGEKVTTVSAALHLRERRRAEDQEQSAGRYSEVLTEEAKRRGGSGGGLLDGLGGGFLEALTFPNRYERRWGGGRRGSIRAFPHDKANGSSRWWWWQWREVICTQRSGSMYVHTSRSPLV